MKKKQQIILLTFIFLILFSCNDKKYLLGDPTPRIDTIRIDTKYVTKVQVNYSSLFDKIEYIQIPTDSNCLVGKIDKLLVTDDYLFVMDRKISRSVFAFDKRGNKVLQINKNGNGPGEYIDIKDISYLKKSKELLIYCYIRKKLLHYDLEGNFLRETNIPYYSLRVQPVDGSYALCTDYDLNNNLKQSRKFADLILLDSDRETILSTANYFTPPISRAVVMTSEAQFSQLNDTLFSIKPDHCNIIYHATPNEIYPAYRIDFGQYSIDERYWQKTSQKGIKYKEVDEYSKYLKLCESFRFLEGQDYIHFVYRQTGHVYTALYSKKTKTLHHTETFQNDMDLVTLFRPVAIHNDKFYCLLESEDVYRMKDLPINTIPQEIMDNVQEFGNPIIAIFTLKPF